MMNENHLRQHTQKPKPKIRLILEFRFQYLYQNTFWSTSTLGFLLPIVYIGGYLLSNESEHAITFII